MTEVDGVPVFWAPFDGFPQQVELHFRVGTADEPLALHGITHLIEHLALHRLGDPAFELNGEVTSVVTTFEAAGTREEIVRFVRDVTRELSNLPWERLDAEKRVLAAEGAGASPAQNYWLRNRRFGAATYGLHAKREIGLHALDQDAIEAWRRSWFTRGNLTIWMTGEPPDSFGLELPEGGRRPLPEPEPLPGLELPAIAFAGSGEVSVGLMGPENAVFRAAMAIAERRLYEELRLERGIVYAVEHCVSGAGAGRTHAALWVECPDTVAAEVLEQVLGQLDDLAEDGPTEQELEHQREHGRRVQRDFQAVLAELAGTAHDAVCGAAVKSIAEWVDEREAMTATDCAGALADALPTAIVEAPESVPRRLPNGFVDYDAARAPLPRPEGPVFREKDATDCSVGPCDCVIGGGYMYMQHGDGSKPTTIRWQDVAAVGGQAGAAQRLIERDGSYLVISEWAYHDGPGLIAALRERIPAERWIPPRPADRVVDDAARRDLEQPELVVRELRDLARSMGRDERVLALATHAAAGDGGKPGLLAITDRRVVVAFDDEANDGRDDRWSATTLDRVGAPVADEDEHGRPRLRYEIDGKSESLNGVASPEVARHLADLLASVTNAPQPA